MTILIQSLIITSCILRLLTSSLDLGLVRYQDSAPPKEMQRSAAEARNKNRSAICFDYEPEPRAPAPEAPKAKASKASKEAKAKVPKVPKVKAEEVKPGDLDGKDLGGLMVSISFQSDSL